MHNHSRVIGLVLAACIVRVATASAQATLEIQDYLVMPITGASTARARTSCCSPGEHPAGRGRRREAAVHQRPQRTAVHPRQGHEEVCRSI